MGKLHLGVLGASVALILSVVAATAPAEVAQKRGVRVKVTGAMVPNEAAAQGDGAGLGRRWRARSRPRRRRAACRS